MTASRIVAAESNNSYETQTEIIQAGRADALIVWWELHLDTEQRFSLSTAPAWVSTCAEPSIGNHPGASISSASTSTLVENPLVSSYRQQISATTEPSSTGSPGEHCQDARVACPAEGQTVIRDQIRCSADAEAASSEPRTPAAESQPDVRQKCQSSADEEPARGHQTSQGSDDESAARAAGECSGGRKQEWRDHWKTCWASVAGSSAGESVSPGQTCRIHASHDDTSISVGATIRPLQPDHGPQASPHDSPGRIFLRNFFLPSSHLGQRICNCCPFLLLSQTAYFLMPPAILPSQTTHLLLHQ